MAVSIEYEDCDSSMINFWKNVETLDPILNLSLTSMAFSGYFSHFEENKNKTLKDFELELRERDLNVGLIAVKIDENTKKAIHDKKIIYVKSQYAHLYKT
jgi:hypothetical protein